MPFGCRSPNYYIQFYIGMNKAKLLFAVIPKYFVVVVILKGLNLVWGCSGPNWNWTGSSAVPFSGSSSHIGTKLESSEPSPYDSRPPYHSHQPTTRETSRPSIQRTYVHNKCAVCVCVVCVLCVCCVCVCVCVSQKPSLWAILWTLTSQVCFSV